MQTVSYQVAIPQDRRINLDLPLEIAPGPADLLVVVQPRALSTSQLSIADLGWTPIKAAVIREQLASFVEDWDDPRMDVYNEL